MFLLVWKLIVSYKHLPNVRPRHQRYKRHRHSQIAYIGYAIEPEQPKESGGDIEGDGHREEHRRCSRRLENVLTLVVRFELQECVFNVL